MADLICQRWREGRDNYRPAGEPIATHRYEVAAIADDATAKAFVTSHHYSGTYPAARRRFGLYRAAELVGVAVFSEPMNARVLSCALGEDAGADGVELGRFVLQDDVPANGETWFLARCFARLRVEGFSGVVSFSDPMRRRNARGEVVFGGHVGTIYQAHNACYLGRATPRTLTLLPDGQVFSDRAAQKIRKREQGWDYAVRQLVAQGARAPHVDEDSAVWLREALGTCRRLRHRGNHRYAWGFSRAVRRGLARRNYPKRPAMTAEMFGDVA